MTRVVTPYLMGDPQARKVRAPTLKEREASGRSQPKIPASPSLVAYEHMQSGERRMLQALVDVERLTIQQIAETANLSLSTAKKFTSNLRVRFGVDIAYKDHAYRLTPDGYQRAKELLAAPRDMAA